MDFDSLSAELRNLVYVQPFHSNSFAGIPNLRPRFTLLNPEWRIDPPPHIFVDGVMGACRWNCCQVVARGLNKDATFWCGYAFHSFGWHQHGWFMLNGKIIETTHLFRIYYGAELTWEEARAFCSQYGAHDLLTQRSPLQVWTIVNRRRGLVDFDPAKYGNSIGRQRDLLTGDVLPGLDCT